LRGIEVSQVVDSTDILKASLSRIWVGICFLVVPILAQASGTNWTAESVPQYDQLFQQTNGWSGADGDFAVSLTNGLTLWLFSDTFVGKVHAGRRVRAKMIHNSAAFQHGVDLTNAHVEFFYGKTSDGKPTELITPTDGRGWFWLFDGAMAQGKLFLFLAQIERTDDKSVFGFRQIGTWLGEVSNPFESPTQWHIIQRQIPFARFGSAANCSYGSALLAANGFIYIFGTNERKPAGKTMILARAPERSLSDFASWRFRTRNDWSTNAEAAVDLCSGMASEYSVSWSAALRQFVLICTENGLSEKIIGRTAKEPWGPWSSANVIYRCPEVTWDKQVFCYAAKAHPMLVTAPNELIVTYAANSFEFAQIVNDARLYWPRFVRVKLPSNIAPEAAPTTP
jgi:hypothetical protein